MIGKTNKHIQLYICIWISKTKLNNVHLHLIKKLIETEMCRETSVVNKLTLGTADTSVTYNATRMNLIRHKVSL